MQKQKIGLMLISLVTLAGIIGAFMLDPVAQDPGYHQFADQQILLGIPNFWNVLSNLPFLLVGLTGLYDLYLSHKANIDRQSTIAYGLFFSGISLVSLGSGYYHLWPDNFTLVWDRLPMTIAFMALFAIIIGEFISSELGRKILWPLIILGGVSVIYWYITETNGNGDLKPYILIQFLPMLLIPIILGFFPSAFTHIQGYWLLLGAYLLAKIFESYDESVYNLFHFISGHSMKHIVAAFGVWLLLRAYKKRKLSL